jgi:hypothetical protein
MPLVGARGGARRPSSLHPKSDDAWCASPFQAKVNSIASRSTGIVRARATFLGRRNRSHGVEMRNMDPLSGCESPRGRDLSSLGMV